MYDKVVVVLVVEGVTLIDALEFKESFRDKLFISDSIEALDEDDDERESSEKIQSIQISRPPMDEATAKLHEKYEIVEERLSHAREQQK